jgi:predicted regulator of Ras-like GTPase activity (Roadblock/LC7/MglB family)
MTVHASQLSADARNFNWLLSRFASETADVRGAIAVSSDGLLIAMSSSLDRTSADRLAAITSAITSLAKGASRHYDLGEPNKVIIDLEYGYVLVSTIGAGSSLGVLASKSASLGTIAYEMALFGNRAGAVLTPKLIEELKYTVSA